jgi:fructosamine-3-kinase
MKSLVILAALTLVGCSQSEYTPTVLTYQQLVDYPVSCEKATQQLAELHKTQVAKNFGPDPDNLTDLDRAYNSRLKATIWWYAYRCNQS